MERTAACHRPPSSSLPSPADLFHCLNPPGSAIGDEMKEAGFPEWTVLATFLVSHAAVLACHALSSVKLIGLAIQGGMEAGQLFFC